MSFSAQGMSEFAAWIPTAAPGSTPPMTNDLTLTASYFSARLDESAQFPSRYQFGSYLNAVLGDVPQETLLAPESDGMWAWVNAVYFPQLTSHGVRRLEHYIPVRNGSFGSLLHRNAARTAYELVATHGENARFALQQPIRTHGQLLESLTATQSVVRNKGFFAAAAKMYVSADGRIKRGATSKPKPFNKRAKDDDVGKGSIRRLPVALRRLDLTYDVEVLAPGDLIRLLPKEFDRWTRESATDKGVCS